MRCHGWEAKRVPGACLPRGLRIWGEFPGPSSVELSSLLVRNVSYEIPSLKKQIAKCQQLQQEYSRREEEGQAGAAEMRERFYHSCKQYGVTVSLGGPEHSSSAAHHSCLRRPLPSSLGRQRPKRAAGPGEGPAESAG